MFHTNSGLSNDAAVLDKVSPISRLKQMALHVNIIFSYET
jgi:hypothetical protein